MELVALEPAPDLSPVAVVEAGVTAGKADAAAADAGVAVVDVAGMSISIDELLFVPSESAVNFAEGDGATFGFLNSNTIPEEFVTSLSGEGFSGIVSSCIHLVSLYSFFEGGVDFDDAPAATPEVVLDDAAPPVPVVEPEGTAAADPMVGSEGAAAVAAAVLLDGPSPALPFLTAGSFPPFFSFFSFSAFSASFSSSVSDVATSVFLTLVLSESIEPAGTVHPFELTPFHWAKSST